MNSTSYADDSYIKKLYQYEQWGGSTQTNYLRLIEDWIPDFPAYGTTNWISLNREALKRGDLSHYAFLASNLTSQVTLRFIETASVIDAHEMLMWFFEHCSAIQPFQTGESIGVFLGDHCYGGYPIGLTNGLFFVRNNMFITITSGSSVYEIAQKIDQQLLDISIKPTPIEPPPVIASEAKQPSAEPETAKPQPPSPKTEPSPSSPPITSIEAETDKTNPSRLWLYLSIGVLLCAIVFLVLKRTQSK